MKSKHEWRRSEKSIYIPSTTPEIIDIPNYKFLLISGACNPNSDEFARYIQALYSVSYAIKMNLKKMDLTPSGYCDWTVYPLEGVWDISEKAKKNYSGVLDKNELVFDLMIRQPSFVNSDFFDEMSELVNKKKPQALLSKLRFEELKEGRCIQMMHIGSYDNEPASFKKMEAFAEENNVKRESKLHREIYLSDFRKVPEEKLKTALRFRLEG